MRDDFNVPNMGDAPVEYNQSYINRTIRNLEMTFTLLRNKGLARFTRVETDEIVVKNSLTVEDGGVIADNYIANGPAATSRFFGMMTNLVNRWLISADVTPESGANAGSDFAIYRYNDAGAYLGQPFYIQRSTGDIYLENDLNVDGDLTVTGAVTLPPLPYLPSAGGTITGDLTRSGAAATNRLVKYDTSGSLRWTVGVDDTAESGSDTGSDFLIKAYDDTGVFLYNALKFDRETGETTVGGGPVVLDVGQIKFPAAQFPSSNANTLDDYEEGTWTPTLTFVTPGNLSVAYSQRVGIYTKVGNLVTLSWTIVTSTWTHTTASGNLTLSGLPFACDVIGNLQITGVLSESGIITASGNFVTNRILPGATTVEFVLNSTVGGARTVATTAHATTGTQQVSIGSLSYRTST